MRSLEGVASVTRAVAQYAARGARHQVQDVERANGLLPVHGALIRPVVDDDFSSPHRLRYGVYVFFRDAAFARRALGRPGFGGVAQVIERGPASGSVHLKGPAQGRFFASLERFGRGGFFVPDERRAAGVPHEAAGIRIHQERGVGPLPEEGFIERAF